MTPPNHTHTDRHQELDADVAEYLNELLQAHRESVAGYREAAEALGDEHTDLSGLFRDIAADRERFADELAHHVDVHSDEKPENDESLGAKLHQTWIKIRAAINVKDREVVLCETIRGEKHLKREFEEAMPKIAGSHLTSLLNERYSRLTQTLERLEQLEAAA